MKDFIDYLIEDLIVPATLVLLLLGVLFIGVNSYERNGEVSWIPLIWFGGCFLIVLIYKFIDYRNA
jgi:uncharacterized RDD family membrane protein YckC